MNYYSNYSASFTTCLWLNARILLSRLMKIWLSKAPGQLHTVALGAESELEQPPWSDTRPRNCPLPHFIMSVIKFTKNAPSNYLGLRTGRCGPSFACTSDLQRRVKCGKECPAEPALGEWTFMKEAVIPPVPQVFMREGRAEKTTYTVFLHSWISKLQWHWRWNWLPREASDKISQIDHRTRLLQRKPTLTM